jgi:serine/threonine protein kinase
MYISHIVGFYGVCTEVGHASLIMEYMPKGSLYGVLQNKREDLPWLIRWNIAIDIGKGIHYLHCRHILHRDLKSLNVLLGDHYQAKLCDFGLSKIKIESASTTTNNKAGTVRWRAPETFKRGYKPATSMDIYSYGMVLWEIASRAIPFADGDEQTVISWLKDGEKETIPEDCPEIYGDMIKKCWLDDPQSRPSAQVIPEALEKAKPVLALPAPTKSKKPTTYVEKPWHFDPLTERKADPSKLYQLLEATHKDKTKVVSFYQHYPVSGYEIGSVEVIYNRKFNQGFEIQIEKLQGRHNNPAFVPSGKVKIMQIGEKRCMSNVKCSQNHISMVNIPT